MTILARFYDIKLEMSFPDSDGRDQIAQAIGKAISENAVKVLAGDLSVHVINFGTLSEVEVVPGVSTPDQLGRWTYVATTLAVLNG